MTRGWALFWGLVLVLIGGLALLFNLGLLQPEQLSRLAALWPLLLILVGLQIVLVRLLPRPAAAIAVSVLAFLLVAGSITYVVSAPPARQAHRDFKITGQAGAAAVLRVELGAATIGVEAGSVPGGLASGSIDYRSGLGQAPRVQWDQGSRTLDISHSLNGGPFIWAPNSPDHLTLVLDSSTPWSIELATGASTTRLSLAELTLRRMSVRGGAATLDITLGSPSGRVPISISGGATKVSIARPAAAPLHVEVSGGANSISVDGHDVGGAIGSASWSSPSYPAADAFMLTVSGGANKVTVTTSG